MPERPDPDRDRDRDHDITGDPLDRGLAAAFGPGPESGGALETLADAIGPVPRVLLCDTDAGDEGPLVKPTSTEVPELREAIRLRPNYAQAHFYLGYNLVPQGKLDEAIAAYKRPSDGQLPGPPTPATSDCTILGAKPACPDRSADSEIHAEKKVYWKRHSGALLWPDRGETLRHREAAQWGMDIPPQSPAASIRFSASGRSVN